MVNEKKIDIIKKSRPFTIADVVVFVLIVAAIVVLLLTVYSGGDTVRITYDGTVAEYSLSIDNEINIEDKLTVVIKNKSVYVKHATCPDKVCVYSGSISRQNQMLVCVPYGIVISIVTGDDRWV